MSLALGDRLGPYEVLSQIGSGGMGEVYRARDTRLGRDVAIKVLPAEFAADRERLVRFEREAKATAALSHRNILDVHDVGAHDGAPYLVEELLEGESLKERLDRGALPVREALEIGVQVARGLAAAHEKGIIHRDLKPGNVFLTRDGTVKILDFGLAKLVERASMDEADTLTHAPTGATEIGRVLGTAAYMAPEQARGKPVDQRADVFSLGCVLYEMLAGERAFRGATMTDTLAAILKDEPAPLPHGVPTQLAAVIGKCLAKDPTRRYQRGSEVLAALEAAQHGEAPPLWRTVSRAVRRRPWLAVLNVVTVTGVLMLALDLGGVRTRLLGRDPGGQRIDSLAVLPLENLSGDPEQEYLAAGMHDALITNLGQLTGVRRVIARGSVLRFKGTSEPPKEIARELGVAGLVTGAVLRSGNRVRVTAQLIDPASQTQLWAHSYERELRDVLALENDIVAAITREIRVKLTAQEEARLAGARPVDPEVFEACQKGRFHYYKLSREDLDTAERYFRLALEKDPNCALAHEGIAIVWMAKTDSGFIPPDEALPKARAAALKALELDDTLAEAHMTMANLKVLDWEWPAADREFRRALELNPNLAEAHFMYADYLVTMRRDAEWNVEVHRALEIDPLNFLWPCFHGWHLVYVGRYDEAIAELDQALREEPNSSSVHMGLWGAYFKKGMDREAFAEAKRFFAILHDSEVVAALDAGWATGGYRGAMRLAGEKLAARSERTHVSSVRIARVFAHAGENSRALDFLERAYQRHETPVYHIGVGREWDALRPDPRYQALIRAMKLPET
jgi:TolB-like protein